MAKTTPKKTSHPLAAAIRELNRMERFNIGALLALYLLMTVTFPISWITHNAGLQMQVSSIGTFLMYFVCVWHSLHVKGKRQTAAFFVLSWILPFTAEILGSNYGLIFGSYDYTKTMGPAIAGVPLLIPFSWSILQYSAFMFIDGLLGLGGERRGVSWYGRAAWSALVGLASGAALAAMDLIIDPAYVSRVWDTVLGAQPWWWWEGGAYLPDLQAWKGAGGIPVQNFLGWAGVTFVTIFIFHFFFQEKDRPVHRLLYVIPPLLYALSYYVVILELAEMQWYDPGLVQPALIGTFAVGPLILLAVLKFCKDYWTPPEAVQSRR